MRAKAKRADFTVEERWAYEQTCYFDYCQRIWDFSKPTVAQVQEACVASRFMLANMCDLVVVWEDAFFSDPVTHTTGAVATEVLIHPCVMSLRKAKEMLFTSGKLTAVEAQAIGDHRVIPCETGCRRHRVGAADCGGAAVRAATVVAFAEPLDERPRPTPSLVGPLRPAPAQPPKREILGDAAGEAGLGAEAVKSRQAMRLTLTEEHSLIESTVRDFLASEYDFACHQRSVQAPRQCEPRVWRQFADMG